MIPSEADDRTREVLERYGFDAVPFAELRARVAAGELSADSNVVEGAVEPPAPEELTPVPAPGDAGYAEAWEAGVAALRGGRVAVVVLGGGMATRFGGVVKGTVEAVDGRSFLEIKLADAAAAAAAVGADVPVAVMTSFATDRDTRSFVAERGMPEPLWFSQFVSLRLERDGSLFRDGSGALSPYGPGHGDLFDALRRSGLTAALRRRGVEILLVSNVDNLGARVDPLVVGVHVLAGRPMTSEVAAKEGDMGGAPVRVNGRLQLLETPRFPPGFDHDAIPVFNTNTALFDLAAIDRPFDLTWLYVEKEVDGRRAVQLERLYHEASAFLDTTYLVVPRTGRRGRFFPIKTPDDLVRSRGALREMLAASPLEG